VTDAWWALVALLVAGAVVLGWPDGTSRRRLRPPQRVPRAALPSVDRVAARRRLHEVAERPRRAILVSALAGAAAGGLVAGPVAALVVSVYAALAARAFTRRSVRARNAAARSRSLDDLGALAADLRAGLPPAAATEAGAAPGPSAGPDPRIAELTTAVWRLAERTGAPAADLVERIEADARAADRAHASAAAQVAGAQATALLLAALPAGGIALGFGLGVDPLDILLHSVLGAACAVGAVLLQGAGLLWADRLSGGPSR
jgi:tight adherence protein B